MSSAFAKAVRPDSPKLVVEEGEGAPTLVQTFIYNPNQAKKKPKKDADDDILTGGNILSIAGIKLDEEQPTLSVPIPADHVLRSLRSLQLIDHTSAERYFAQLCKPLRLKLDPAAIDVLERATVIYLKDCIESAMQLVVRETPLQLVYTSCPKDDLDLNTTKRRKLNDSTVLTKSHFVETMNEPWVQSVIGKFFFRQ
mmetsp:Transcript_9574/g.18664  ORF Transcript_9574/g.18664 Transcript_9574/m.18664 type:complete len:197 (-) Transcript_9574:1420-2010(-)